MPPRRWSTASRPSTTASGTAPRRSPSPRWFRRFASALSSSRCCPHRRRSFPVHPSGRGGCLRDARVLRAFENAGADACDRIEPAIRRTIPSDEVSSVIDNIGLPYSLIITSAPIGTRDAAIFAEGESPSDGRLRSAVAQNAAARISPRPTAQPCESKAVGFKRFCKQTRHSR